jgi:choice-of-anchor A domain-containing protein
MKKIKLVTLVPLLVFISLWLIACGDSTPVNNNQTQTPTGPTSTPVSSTGTATATPIQVNQLATATPLPVATTAPVATNAPLPSATANIPTSTPVPATATPVPATPIPDPSPVSVTATPQTAATLSSNGATVTNFNLLVFEDLNLTAGGSQISGPVGAGRDANFVNYNLATGQAGNADNVLVGRNLKLRGGQVKGNAVYGTGKTIEGTNFDQGQALQRANPLPVDGLRNYVENVAQMWKSQNGTSLATKYNGYAITAGPGISYFKLKGSELANATSLQIDAPEDATLVLNVDGASDQMHNMGINLAGGIGREHLVFNFYEATSLKINGVQVEGSVWAPKAMVNFNNGAQRGSLVARSLTGGSVSFEHDPFQGTLPQ